MQFACNRNVVAAAFLLFSFVNANTIITAPASTSSAISEPATCEFRTINYITDSLPQQCLKSSWSSSSITAATAAAVVRNATGEGYQEGIANPSQTHSPTTTETSSENDDPQKSSVSAEPVSHTSELPPASIETAEESATDIDTGELNEASFLSFEDWKKQTLEKAGQANANIGHKKPGGKRDSETIQNNLDTLGDEGEIELDFGAFRSEGSEEGQASQIQEPDAQASQDLEGGKKKDQYRSKDAGITCKERFSYASFDAGATILKTHHGAKNSKAVLIENKDSYMLSNCATENKFLIVELSEDIWIDTVVLANYEFFSSMIRTFRVSVSDRYPVKMEKWKDLGVYEARNSREIQAFLIENPQIWARYLRIEFLTHYGNEYYCPLSLLRVHGTRMLESWKETEAGGDDDDSEEEGHGEGEHFTPEAVAEPVLEEERLSAELKEAQNAIEDLIKTAKSISDQVKPALSSSHIIDVDSRLRVAAAEGMTSPWARTETEIFRLVNADAEVCVVSEAPRPQMVVPDADLSSSSVVELDRVTPMSSAGSVVSSPLTTATTTQTNGSSEDVSSSKLTAASAVVASNLTSMTSSMKESVSSAIASAANKTSTLSSASAAIVSRSQNITASHKNKTTATSSASSSLPTIQESFFKAVSRRLQLLEANSTLSLKYIEEQSKILREAFTKVEKKQLQKTSLFLESLNTTVLAELRGFRQQYDEIWQSTIISLESARDESRREILAISSRLNILADEVVFQKRMSIVQSVLLLLCLGLVIFSRVSAGGHLDFPTMQARARNVGFPISPLESPPESPEYQRTGSRQWLETGEPRRNGSPISRRRTGDDDDSLPSISFYSRSENALTPSSGADDSTEIPIGEQSELEDATENSAQSSPVSSNQELLEEQSPDNSPSIHKAKKRKILIRRDSSPLTSNSLHPDVFPSPLDHSTQDQYPIPAPPSPPPETEEENEGIERPSFSIARKPLPALPDGI